MKYDLAKRTSIFARSVIKLIKTFTISEINKNIISQLIRSSSSVGANYREANGVSSKKDFHHKIHICKKEIQETKYWLELFAEAETTEKDRIKKLWEEAHELTLIFNKISTSLNEK